MTCLRWMLTICAAWMSLLFQTPDLLADPPQTSEDLVILVQGASGEPAYEALFTEWMARWTAAASREARVLQVGVQDRQQQHADHTPAPMTTGADLLSVAEDNDGLQESGTPLAQLESILLSLDSQAPGRLWIVLIGHGTDDGRTPKFNLEGPDLTADQLAQWLDVIGCPTAVIHCGSASARFIPRLSRPGRVIITATRSPSEVNFARFGDALSQSLEGTAGDLDKDGQTSLLEAFLRASRLTQQFYDGEGRLATEHALLDDNGDGRGSSVDSFPATGHLLLHDPASDGWEASRWFLVPAPEESWLTPELRTRRDDLEQQLRELRAQRSHFEEDEYYAALELLLVEYALLYAMSDTAPDDSPQRTDPASTCETGSDGR